MFTEVINDTFTKTQFESLSPGIILIKQKSFFQQRLAYWFRGMYGNFILGTPIPTKDVIEKLKALGGVFRIIPWDSNLGDDHLAMFNRFGAHFVTTEQSAKDSHVVPVLSWRESPIVGVKFRDFSSTDGKNFFCFEWQDETYTNMNSKRNRNDFFFSSGVLTKNQSVGKTTNFEAGVLNDKLNAENRKIVVAAHNAHRLLILFDDVEYERNDYEVISPRQRKQLGEYLKKIGYSHKSGNVFLSPDGQGTVNFSKPPRALASPVVDNYTLSNSGVNVVTATQGAFIILNSSEFSSAKRARELKRLVTNIPINLKKIKMLDRPIGFDENSWRKLMHEIAKLQKPVIEYYRTNKVNGIIGRPRIKKPLTIDIISLI